MKVKRNSGQVRNKIEMIEAQMRSAVTWAAQTGQGVQEEDLQNGTKNFEDNVSSSFQLCFITFQSTVCLIIMFSIQFVRQVKKRCKYYYDLVDKFASRAGIVPKNTSANLFSTTTAANVDVGELHDEDNESLDDKDDPQFSSSADPPFADDQPVNQDSTTAPAAAASTGQKTSKSTRKSKKSKTNHPQTNSLEYLLTSIARGELEKQKKQSKDNSIAQKVELAEQFKRMSDALGGSKIKAAYHCKEFVVLLDKNEKAELKKYADEQESDSD